MCGQYRMCGQHREPGMEELVGCCGTTTVMRVRDAAVSRRCSTVALVS